MATAALQLGLFDLPQFTIAEPPSRSAAAAPLPPGAAAFIPPPAERAPFCLSEIPWQDCAKRVLEIALAGGHNVLFVGPPEAPIVPLQMAANALADQLCFPADMRPIIFHAEQAGSGARADLTLDLAPTSEADLSLREPRETSDQVAVRIAAARLRFDEWAERGEPVVDEAAERLLAQARAVWNFDDSTEAAILAVALTIATLSGGEPCRITRIHVAEALSYQPRP